MKPELNLMQNSYNSYKNARWISREDEIESASDDSLLRSICTADGKGSSFKENVIREIIDRNNKRNLSLFIRK